MNVLIACEESQEVCKAFRAKGHNAFSCDLQECSGGHPEWHINSDCLKIINGNCEFWTQDGKYHYYPYKWDLLIAHPPCTYLTVTGNRWFNVKKYGDKAIERMEKRKEAAKFFMTFANADCEHIAIENPVGYISSYWRKPNQIIQPWMFGDAAEKRTCLWTKGLPILIETDVVLPPPRVYFYSGKSMPKWYADAWGMSKEERAKIRSKTFPGIAKAMATQWGKYIEEGSK